MHEIHKIEEKMKELCAICDTLKTNLKCCIDGDLSGVNTQEAGEVVDMIKDISEVEKNLYKAEYYKKVIEAMEKGEDGRMPFMFEDGRLTPMEEYEYRAAGYNNYRYPSSGRYASSGHGQYYGYRPTMDGWSSDFYGYDGGSVSDPTSGNNSSSSNSQNGQGRSGYMQMPMTDIDMENMAEDVMRKNPEFRRGMPYREYSKTRRYYTESHRPEDKKEMDQHTKEHVLEFAASVKEMYQNADPEIKRMIKENLTKLVGELM